MRKITLIVHTSLDGLVAGAKGELDGFEYSDENLGFVCDIAEKADAALFGRVSYHLLDNYWPAAASKEGATKNEIRYSNWYNSAVKIVLSKTLHASGLKNTIVISDNISTEITKIKQQPGKDILIFGSPSAFRSLFQLGLVDDYWVFVNPAIFGKGIPLFTGNENAAKLRLVATKQLSNGEMALQYITEQKQP